MSSSPDGGIPSAGPSLDTAFGLLADETRRLSLYVLREHGGMSLADLADVVTGWSAVRRGDGRATADDRRERLVSLHHTHVPKLRAAGVVTYDDETGVVAFASPSEAFDRLLDAALAIETEAGETAVPEPEQ
ncbi:DUF7344 domain-containing protein [Halosegnis marinus]|uniref:DUF7344 domain-containing protein n=1 Tax=Halosegnis marinus TaxID=3034023 RepID=A0ABD5ZK25_9EURY|nr:transcriptional regulator [Halosegnis sp. DT85]